MKKREILLLIMLPVQMALCALSQKEIPTSNLILLVFLLTGASLFFWGKAAPPIRDRERAEKRTEFHIRRCNFFKLNTRGIKLTAKSNVTVTMIVAGVLTSIALTAFTVVFVVYAANNFKLIISDLIKASRISGLVIFIAGCVSLIRNAAINKRIRQRSFMKENITSTGLIIENMLLSMIAFVY